MTLCHKNWGVHFFDSLRIWVTDAADVASQHCYIDSSYKYQDKLHLCCKQWQ